MYNLHQVWCPENPLKVNANECAEQPPHQCPSSKEEPVPPQPRFVLGYEGCIPDSGHLRSSQLLGQGIGRQSHRLLHPHSVGGGRLAPLPDDVKLEYEFREKHKKHCPEVDNPHQGTHLRFLPGYGGYTPGDPYSCGETVAVVTHRYLSEVGGGRLRPISPVREDAVKDDHLLCHLHLIRTRDPLRRADIVSGYCGHIPRANQMHGKGFPEVAMKATADFERIVDEQKTARDTCILSQL